MFKIALLTLALFVFGSFAHALKDHFDTQRMPSGMKILSGFALACFTAISVLSFLYANGYSATLGAILMSLSLVIFRMSVSASRGKRLKVAFDRDVPASILSDGIYASVRHPMYLSYIVFWLGFAIGSGSYFSALPALVMIVTYVALARAEERKLLASSNASTYAAHISRTGMFWPKR